MGLLGILKAGGAYVPLDPDYPEARWNTCSLIARCRVVLSEQHLIDGSVVAEHGEGAAAGPGLARGAVWRVRRCECSRRRRERGWRPSNLAYVIYTSGSTGQPKGSAVTHQNSQPADPATISSTYAEARTILCAASPSFDAFTFELWGASAARRAQRAGRSHARKLSQSWARSSTVSASDCAWLTSSLFNQLLVDSPECAART